MGGHAQKDIEYHDDIASDYERTVVAPRTVTNDTVYSKLLRLVPSGSEMLDLGCGTGHLTGRAGKRFENVVAVDHSAGMLAEARRKASSLGIHHVDFILKDAISFLGECEDERFDFVGCVGFLHHLKEGEIRRVLLEVHRVLTKNGHALFQEPIRIPPATLPVPIERWNARSVVVGMSYCHTAPHPDEAPIDRELFERWIRATGLKMRARLRNWEIFPHTLPPTLKDRLTIRALNLRYGRSGNVYSLLVRKG